MLTGKRKQNNLRSRRTINAANALESKIQIFNIFNNQIKIKLYRITIFLVRNRTRLN